MNRSLSFIVEQRILGSLIPSTHLINTGQTKTTMKVTHFLFVVFFLSVQVMCLTSTFTVEPGNTVNEDTVVSILPNGNVVQGFNVPGMSKLSTDIGYSMSCVLDRVTNKVVLAEITGNILIVQGGGTDNRPIEGTPFFALAIDMGILQLECLNDNTFVIMSGIDNYDGSDSLPFFRMFTVSGLDIIAESVDYHSPIAMEDASNRPRYFLVPQGTSGMLLLGYTNTDIKANRPQECVHWSLNLLATPATAVQDGFHENALTFPANRHYRSVRLDSSRSLLGFWSTDQESVHLMIVQWTGSVLNVGNLVSDPGWDEFIEKTKNLGLPLFDNSVVVITTGDGYYSTLLATGLTLTPQTLDAPIFTTLPPFQTPPTAAEGRYPDIVDLYNDDVVALYPDMLIAGTINPGAPYDITWETPIFNKANGVSRTAILNNGIMGVSGSNLIGYQLTSPTLTYYMFEGESPVGVALTTETGGSLVEVTTSGNHPIGGLDAGFMYYANPDGTITDIPNECCTIQYSSPRVIGVAHSSTSLFINWPNWKSRQEN